MAQKILNSSPLDARDAAIRYGRFKELAKRVTSARPWTGTRVLISWSLAISLCVLGAQGCASAPEEAPPPQVEQMSPPQILYHAILATFQARELPIETASERHLLVSTEFQPAGKDLRKQITARVIQGVPGAMGLKLTTAWQHQNGDAEHQDRPEHQGESSWQPIQNPELSQRAQADELAIGREIEAKFSAWKGRWRQADELESP